jgi:uncharacterized protein
MSFRQVQVSDQLKRVVGEGIAFPVIFSEGKGNEVLIPSTGLNVIYQSLSMLLSTRIGERYNNPEYGTRLHELLFRPLDAITLSNIQTYVIDAIERWEKRITIVNVTTEPYEDQSQVDVKIEFQVRNTNVFGSYVYPFVKEPMPENQLIQGNIFVVGRLF